MSNSNEKYSTTYLNGDMQIIHFGVRDAVRMCHMVDLIFVLGDMDFFYPDALVYPFGRVLGVFGR